MQGAKNLTQGAIGRQLFNLAMPIMGTSFIQMAYSITDMAWVGRLGSEAVAAVGAVGILTWMTNSLTLLGKVGSEVSVAQSIGARNADDARRYASHNTTISLLLSLGWGLLLFLFAYPIISLYKLAPDIAANSVEYLRIVTTAFPFVFLTAAFTGIHNAAGRSKIPFLISGTGLILNMLLDPLFIFVFQGGTAGAAWATWISEGVVFLLFVWQIKRRSNLLGGFRFFAPLQRKYAGRVIKLGLPVSLLNAFFAFINLMMGRTASLHGGHIGLMTLTAGGQLEAIAWNTSQGFSTALSSFVAQNYAAGKTTRVVKAFRATLSMALGLGVVITFLFLFYGNELFSLIVPEREAYLAGGQFLRIDGYSMILMMVEITIQGVLYGMGRTMPPAIVSITFNLLRIPLAIWFSSMGMGVEGVWWAISLTSMLKGIVLFIWFKCIRLRQERVA
ncbi:MATE family efflux transporter [Parabacteroides sp. OttesenSCG-928-N08]|nr:MATE family efflux transporter [Parabacteroides sp. OttesenSCG-928-N08]